MKAIKFPGYRDVAGVDQGYAPLPFRKDMIKVNRLGQVVDQPQLMFAFKPNGEELTALNNGEAIYLSLWHDVIPPMQLFIGPTEDTLPEEVAADVEFGEQAYRAMIDMRNKGWFFRVFLDNVEQKATVYANRKTGVLRRIAMDEKGQAIIRAANWQIEEVSGEVRFELERVA
jgi:hypothetical protein